METIDIKSFLSAGRECALLDVRTPAEFALGHIPGAHNLPLLGDEERAEIGTIYKQESRDAAVMRALEMVGPRMPDMVRRVRNLTGGQEILLHCWRGGMRSSSVGWLLQTAGFKVRLLQGGYKAYRAHVLESCELQREVLILGGYTGSGKTEILQHLGQLGAPVVDLEGLAHHKGSSFGALGEAPQPRQQQFENNLAAALDPLDPAVPVWMEDESARIGAVTIPQALRGRMQNTRVIFLDMPVELRITRLIEDYAGFAGEDLQAAIERVERRLGGTNTRLAIDALKAGDLQACCRVLLLSYYDKTYLYGLNRRDSQRVFRLDTNTADARENAQKVLAFCESEHAGAAAPPQGHRN